MMIWKMIQIFKNKNRLRAVFGLRFLILWFRINLAQIHNTEVLVMSNVTGGALGPEKGVGVLKELLEQFGGSRKPRTKNTRLVALASFNRGEEFKGDPKDLAVLEQVGIAALALHKGIRSVDQLVRVAQGMDPLHTIEEIVAGWEEFYRDWFGIRVDLSRIAIPKVPGGGGRYSFMVRGCTLGAMLSIWKSMAGVYVNDQLSFQQGMGRLSHECKMGERDYCYISLGHVLPDHLTWMSSGGWGGLMTLQERILLGLKFHYDTGGFLDIEPGMTQCMGSVFIDGQYRGAHPTICYRHGQILIGQDKDMRFHGLGPRAVIRTP